MNKKLLLIDNYDSFTYNLLHLLRELGADADVIRNDQLDLNNLHSYDKIILSPGPGIPSEAGDLLEVIRRYGPTHSILGVCLGEQAIGEVYGARLKNLAEVFHGIQSEVRIIADDYLFEGLPTRLPVGRYHSWVVEKTGFPDQLEILAFDEQGEIQALRHKEYDVRGVQFHPESILTPHGKQILLNFLNH